MAELYAELKRINAERSKTNDPVKLQELDYREEQCREDYRERFACGLLADAMSDFDLECM